MLLVLRRTADITAALRSPRTMAMAALTAGLISVNWGIYVWAIAVDRAVETALGYYINPLVTVVMGAVLLGEKLSRAQLAAVLLACVAVIILTVDAGGLPWVSLALGLFVRLLRLPAQDAADRAKPGILPGGDDPVRSRARLCHLADDVGPIALHDRQPVDMLLLVLCGPVTAVPLILFAFGAKLLRYSSIGIMQYVAPTMIASLCVSVFQSLSVPARIRCLWRYLDRGWRIFTWSIVKQSGTLQRPRRRPSTEPQGSPSPSFS